MKDKVAPGKIRLSYSLLNIWERGDVDGAVKLYFHMDSPKTRQMEEGTELHKKVQDYISENKKYPDWLDFKMPLSAPEIEKQVVSRYNDIFDLKCLLDWYDEETLFEFKTGVSNSMDWARTEQLPFYFLTCELSDIPVRRAVLIHYNQYTGKTDYSVVHNTESLRDLARNVVDTTGPDIYAFFRNEGLI